MALEINRGNNNCIPNSGIAYVIIPDGCDIAEYVQRCYRNNTLSIGGGMGSTAMHEVKVVDGVLNKIKFPSNGSTLGSAVLWLRESFYNKPIIIGAIPEGGKSTNLSANGQQRIYQEAAQRVAEVFLDALSSRVLITALGDLAKPAEVVIKASSRNTQGDVVNVESKDLIKVDGQSYRLNLTKDFELNIINNKGEEDVEGDIIGVKLAFNNNSLIITDHWGNNILLDEGGLSVSDHWGNIIRTGEKEAKFTDAHENEVIFNEEHIQFLCPKFDLGKGKEQMVLGNTLVDLLGQLIDAICNLTVITHAGASGTPINAADFTAIKSKLETALSELSNTD